MFAIALGAAGEPLFTLSPGPDGQAAIRVDASRAGEPISRRLFGKFTEHLHRNIYHGMWAQVIRNPGFESWHCFFSGDEQMIQARDGAARLGRPWPQGLAAHWLGEGAGEVTYALDRNCVNSESAQHIAIRSLQTPAVGVRQEGVYLPVHRQSDYEVSVYARSRGIKAVTLAVRDGERDLGHVGLSGLGEQWQQHRARLRIEGAVAKGTPLTVVVTADEPGDLWLDQLFVFPADHVHGFDRDVVDLCRRARLALLRYPGGNFVSGYHWPDGVGPVDGRPMRRNPAWQCPEYNHVGTDEFMAFCEAVGCEPMICVNAGNGTPAEAAQWVEYCNGPIESKFGGLRARNGHPQPYNVRYWEIGNELYGKWQVGHCSATEYADRYRRFVEAMRKVDPKILFIANGQNADWHAPLLETHPALVRSFSLHPLIGGGIPRDADPVNAYRSLMAYPTWYHAHLQKLAGQMSEAGVDPRLAITEAQIFTNKRELPNNGSLSEAVYMARYFHTAIRLGGLVEMITHSALVNHGGGLRKQRGVVYAQPSWWATHMYGTMQGTIPLAIDVTTPVYDVSQKTMPAVKNAPYVDAIALTDADRTALTLMLVNTHPEQAIPVAITMNNWPLPKTLTGRQIAGPSFMTRNTWNAPDEVKIRELREPATTDGNKLRYVLPPHSVTELVFRR